MVRLLLWIITFYLIYTVFQFIKQAFFKPPAPPLEKTARGEEMIQDPQCGTYVPRNDAVTGQLKGTTHYFCSTDCQHKYQNRS